MNRKKDILIRIGLGAAILAIFLTMCALAGYLPVPRITVPIIMA